MFWKWPEMSRPREKRPPVSHWDVSLFPLHCGRWGWYLNKRKPDGKVLKYERSSCPLQYIIIHIYSYHMPHFSSFQVCIIIYNIYIYFFLLFPAPSAVTWCCVLPSNEGSEGGDVRWLQTTAGCMLCICGEVCRRMHVYGFFLSDQVFFFFSHCVGSFWVAISWMFCELIEILYSHIQKLNCWI